jgi:hypothetical protein
MGAIVESLTVRTKMYDHLTVGGGIAEFVA